MVRSMALSEKVKSPRRVDLVADNALDRFMRSSLVENAPLGLRRHVEGLVAARSTTNGDDGEASGILSSLMIEAANIVVTTLNSGDVERMVAAREPFDWVIVEEAAKATGPELAGALALGSRRLLIGDHRQLPPYDAERLGKVFANSGVVAKMLANAQSAVGALFDEAVLEQLGRLLGNEMYKDAIMLRARQFVEPFKTVVEEDERRALVLGQPQQLSATLTVQRRMDPAIAELVSRTFYKGTLLTDKERAAEALNGLPPIQCSEALTASPIVAVDFPHVSATKRREGAEQAHAMYGVMMKSPGAIRVRSPLTEVWAPSPSSTKRSADWECRCARATSRGMMSCTPAKSEVVILDCPRMPGFSRTSTRLSACSAVMRVPASSIAFRISSKCQHAGTQALFGSGVMS
jgi:hypothetical protein